MFLTQISAGRRRRRVAVALFRERALLHCTTLFRGQPGVAAAVFREQALLHFTTLFRGQPRCHSEPPRIRRVEESAWVSAE